MYYWQTLALAYLDCECTQVHLCCHQFDAEDDKKICFKKCKTPLKLKIETSMLQENNNRKRMWSEARTRWKKADLPLVATSVSYLSNIVYYFRRRNTHFVGRSVQRVEDSFLVTSGKRFCVGIPRQMTWTIKSPIKLCDNSLASFVCP